jgi:hypothetical protein
VAFVAFDQLIAHREVALGVDGTFLRHQVTHMTIGSKDLEVLAEVFVDRLGFGGRFDDEQILGHLHPSGASERTRAPRPVDAPVIQVCAGNPSGLKKP